MCHIKSITGENKGNSIIKLNAKNKVIYGDSLELTPKTNIMSLMPGTLISMDVEEVQYD